MNKELFYTKDYYTLLRLNEEQEFIELLNENNLYDLVSPALKKITDQLFLLISHSPHFVNIESLNFNGDTLDNKLNEILANQKLFRNIDDINITSKLFSTAFAKLCQRIFKKDGHNDEKYVLQIFVHKWLENNLAKVIVNDKRFSSYEMIFKLIEQTEMLHCFYTSFKQGIPAEWINNESGNWIDVAQSPEHVLESNRTFNKDYFKGYTEQLNSFKDYTSWKYIFESTRFSDHAILSDEYSFKNVILFEKNIDLWLKFWDKLKYPILQDVSFYYIQSPENILNISQELVKQKKTVVSPPKHLAFLLLKNTFASSLRVQENLSFYMDEERVKSLSEHERNNDILTKGKDVYDLWVNERENIFPNIIKILLEIITLEEIEEWIFSFQPRLPIKSNYDTIYNSQIDLLKKAFKYHIAKISFEIQINNATKNFNLQKFNFLVVQVDDKTPKQHIELLLGIISTFIRSEKFYWDRTFSENYWSSLKGIAVLLSLSENPVQKAKELIQDFKVYDEGWNISPSEYKLRDQEAFVYCGAIILLEHNNAFKDTEAMHSYFTDILHLIVSQIRFSVLNLNNYFLPLYLLNVAVNKINHDWKESYDLEIIESLDNFDSTIELLGYSEYPLTPKAKKLFKSRIDIEFNYLKRRLLESDQNQKLEALEKLIEKLKLD